MSPSLAGDPLGSLSARKQIARQFLELVGAGRIDEAYRKYVAPDGRHHNPSFAAGFPALQAGMQANFTQFHGMHVSIRNVIGEGDLVAVHSHVVLRPGEPGIATVHLMRFQADRIVELWDVGQAIPSDSPNRDGVF
jgi:predicted SnoaL-like aldol condensation-catalyzing enzyme